MATDRELVVARDETARFFDEMAPRYDADLVDLGWDPIALVQDWGIVAPPGSTVLDAGCGTGAVLQHSRGAGRQLIGFDHSEGMVNQARRRGLSDARLDVMSASATWPADDDSVDVAFALAMLEFVERLDLALDELGRVLRPGGRALVTVEDRHDWGGIEREAHERRYGEFSLWRRSREEVELCLPPGLEVVREDRVKGYLVLERGFTCAYWVLELRRAEA
ncbi:MAG: ubiquinone/menaquinone biosynthesis C-methylase UbiE [Bradymonadia bacterium]